jgi:HAD superfamily hydrolase (TIGR01549 family)
MDFTFLPSKGKMFKAILFDYNGVLVDDLRIHEEAYLRAARDMGLSLTRETIRTYISTTSNQKRMLYFGEISGETWNQIFQLKTKYYFDLIQGENLLFPEVGDVLSYLAQHYRLGLISNTPRRYFESVFPHSLAILFQETIFGDEMLSPKPSPESLLEMVKRMGMTPDQCCYVGDSVSDVQMAKRAGIKIFSVATGGNSKKELREAGSDWIVKNLGELKERLDFFDLPEPFC